MDIWIIFFRELPFFPGYFVLLMFLSGIYIVLIGPVIFHIFVRPKVEHRYKVSLKLNSNDTITPFPNWGAMPLQFAVYVVFKYFGKETWGMRNPQKNTYLYKLKSIEYDVKTATNIEIVTSFMAIFFIICVVVTASVFLFYLQSQK